MWLSSLVDHLSSAGPILLPVLLDSAIKGLVILALTASATLTMRRSSAAARHLVWFLGTLSLLILPLLSTALPGWYILPRWMINAPAPIQQSTAIPLPPPTLPPAAVPPKPDAYVLPLYTPPQAEVVASPSPTPKPLPIPVQSVLHRTWPGWLLLAWLTGSTLLLGNVALGFLSLWWLGHHSSPITTGHWPKLLQRLCSQVGLRRPVTLLSSPQRAMPMTWGLWYTYLLLPEDSTNWPPEQRSAVLLHELSHARRWDCLTQFLTQLACAFYWFNPLVWLAWRQIQAERERACDDLVLSTGAKPSAYAEQLLHIAAERPAVRFGAAAIAMARPSKLEGRLLAILDAGRNRRTLTAVSVASAAAILLAILIPLAIAQPAITQPATPAIQPTTQPVVVRDSRPSGLEKAATPAPDAAPSRHLARLKSGIVVELLGVAQSPSTGRPWWQADGSPLAQSPYHRIAAGPAQPRPGDLGREFALRQAWGTVDSVTAAGNWVVSPSAGWGGHIPLDAGGHLIHGQMAFFVNIPGSATTVTIRREIAAGPWTQRAAWSAGNSSVGPRQPDALRPVVIADPIQLPDRDRVEIRIAAALPNHEIRLVVIDVAGKEMVAEKNDGATFWLRGYKVEQIAKLRAESRPFDQWVEFRNISLHAGVSTDVQIVTSDDIASSQPAADDHQAIRGTWDLVSADPPFSEPQTHQLKMVIDEKEFRSMRGDQILARSTYSLDRQHQPKWLDLRDVKYPQTMIPAIYEIDDDTLRICQGQSRPSRFAAEPGLPNSILYVMRRAKPGDGPATQAAAPAAFLDFRIAALQHGSSNGLSLSQADEEAALKNLAALGPNSRPPAGFRWRPADPKLDLSSDLLAGQFNNQRYLLLSDSPNSILLADRAGPRTWGLTRIYEVKDQPGSPAIGFDFNPAGAERFGRLTESHIRQPLALLVNDQVLTTPRIMTKITGSGVISGNKGQFTPDRIADLVATLQRGMLAAPVPQPAATPADIELLKITAMAHRSNTQRILTWRGTAEIESVIEDQQGLLLSRMSQSSFLYDRSRQATRWTWTYSASNERQDGQIVSTLNYLRHSCDMTRIRTRDAVYRYEPTLLTADGQYRHALVILPPSDTEAANFSDEFDPMWYLTWHGKDIEGDPTTWIPGLSAAATKVKISAQAGRVLVVIAGSTGSSTFQFDLSQGGNLMEYFSTWDNGSSQSEWTYANQDGVWMPQTFTNHSVNTTAGGQVEKHLRRVRFVSSQLNQPVDAKEFTAQSLGLKVGTRITDNRTGRVYRYNGDAATLRFDAAPPTSQPATTQPAIGKVDSARLEQATQHLKDFQQQYQAGFITALDYERAKWTVKILEAEISGDLAQVTQARLEEATAILKITETMWRSGIVSVMDYEKAKWEVQILDAQRTGNLPRLAQVRLERANALLKITEAMYRSGILPVADFHAAQAEVKSREAEAQTMRLNPPPTSRPTAGVPPQAQPMLDLLESFKTGNADQFVNAFSAPIRATFRASAAGDPVNDRREKLSQATTAFQTRVGPHELSDFTFTYTGTDTSGTLDGLCKGKLVSRSTVILENGQWKLNHN